jgi:hypothetical protein
MAAPTLDDRVRIPARVQYRRVRDEIALVDLDTGAYFGLDECGARMWELLAESGDLHRVVARMQDEYDVAPIQLRDDLLRLVEQLRAAGLLEIS